MKSYSSLVALFALLGMVSGIDPPGVPLIKTYDTTSSTIKISWELTPSPNSPIESYILYYRLEGEAHWQETQISGDYSVHTLRDLQCGSTYRVYLTGVNAVGQGHASEVVTVKTKGSAPIAPDKNSLLSVNSTSVRVHLGSWHDGGCPIASFVVQYRARSSRYWTLVSDNIIPAQRVISITDLSPGTWYSLLMTARNDAGATDAEYVFATLTLPKGQDQKQI